MEFHDDIWKFTVSLFQDSVALFETNVLHLQIWRLFYFQKFHIFLIYSDKSKQTVIRVKTCFRMTFYQDLDQEDEDFLGN